MPAPDPLLVVFDDARARRWSPFCETRPVGELRLGAWTLRERVERVSGVSCEAHLAGSELEGWDEPGAPPCVTPEAVDPSRPRLYWSSRAVAKALPELPRDQTVRLQAGGETVGWSVPAAHASPDPKVLLDPQRSEALAIVEVDAEVLGWPWSLVEASARLLSEDLVALSEPARDPGALPGVLRQGGHPLHLASGAAIGPGVILDLRDGPIRLETGVVVEGPARLVGPLHLGPGCVVFGGHLARVTAGPICKLRGEIADSVLTGYVNKAHDGYLGHALLGRWVNLGAGTTNSDLKNNYGPVRVELPDERVDTGLTKVGVFLGDHVKTGIGTLLTTGGVVGAGSNVFGGGAVAPRHLHAFTWAASGQLEPFRFDRFLEVAHAAMARRAQSLTPGVAAVLQRLWTRAHGAG